MCFEDFEKCPYLEDEKSVWADLPYCVMVYDELTVWTFEELCYKNFTECPVYKKIMEKVKK